MDYDKKLMDTYKRVLKQGGGIPPVICPTTFDKPCKLCELAFEILKDRSLKGTKLYEKAQNLNQKHKYYSNIIFPAINPSQVVVFEYGDKIFKKLAGFHMDPTGQAELKVFMDPMKGRNLFVKKTPGASRDRADYDVEPSMSASTLPDLGVLKHLVPLDNILALMKSGEVKVSAQAKLEAGRTEVRVLPSWLGPKSNMFFFPVNYHYGVTEEEFNAIQAGDMNPFATVKESPVMHPTASDGDMDTITAWSNLIPEEYEEEVPPAPKKEPKKVDKFGTGDFTGTSAYPDCFGSYGSQAERCTGQCIEDGWAGPCRMMSGAKADKEKRAAARRLSK